MRECVTSTCNIRWARHEDWIRAMDMVWKTFLKFEGGDYTEEGVKNFFDFITDESLEKAFMDGRYKMVVAEADGRIVGVGTVRNRNLLSLLFVDEDYHHMKIGTSILEVLWDYITSVEGEYSMIVNAAPYAVDFYKKMGFRQVAPEKAFAGIRVTAMEKPLR
ncbi:MAG: GNAT family N-acetyltransferase [Acetatifactor sp.]|nr:GNAT family N-acetyltransferase [Acetatifactor sp.]